MCISEWTQEQALVRIEAAIIVVECPPLCVYMCMYIFTHVYVYV